MAGIDSDYSSPPFVVMFVYLILSFFSCLSVYLYLLSMFVLS